MQIVSMTDYEWWMTWYDGFFDTEHNSVMPSLWYQQV